MNLWLKNKLEKLLLTSSTEVADELKKDAELMSALGVSSEKDFKDFFYITYHTKNIIKNITGKPINLENLIKITECVYKNKEKYKINNIANFYVAVLKAFEEQNIPITKMAYPQGDNTRFIYSPHNIASWVQTMRVMYSYITRGMSHQEAFNLVTANWDKMNKDDFKKWITFYQQGAHKAYKKASINKEGVGYYEVGSGAFLPLDKHDLRANIPGVPARIPNLSDVEKGLANDPVEQKRQQDLKERQEQEELQKQIKALIGRLNSAERLATTKGINKLLGPVYETWLKALHDLKREIQIAPLRNVKSSLLEDLIVRKANQLFAQGHDLPGKIMIKLAQAQQLTEDAPALDTEIMPPDSMSDMPDMPDTDSGDEWVSEFLENLSGITNNDDDQDVQDSHDNLYVDEDDLVVVAQTVPQQTSTDIDTPKPSDPVEEALKNITVDDVINKLESLAHVFKNRELSRQLAIVDMMMASLGIASYFPNLAEATQRSLDANQYILTRVEDILAKLRGTVETFQKIDFEEKQQPINPSGAGVVGQLDIEEEKEEERRKAREEARKAKEDAEIAAGQQAQTEQQPIAPETDPTAELAQPTQIEQPGPGVRV